MILISCVLNIAETLRFGKHSTAQLSVTRPANPATLAADPPVRMVEHRPGGTWFVATDVVAALEYRDAPDMTRNLDKGIRSVKKRVLKAG